jgi:catechol 2,3-dioxygenase-like lactoylglutathione lyase family enzyme
VFAGVFDHVTIRVSDRIASEQFYDAVLRTLGIDETYRTAAFSEWQEFSLTGADDSHPRTRRLHVAFAAPTREQVREFWRAAVEAGYVDDGPPGPRPEYGPDYYGAFVLDPDGNSAEAVHHRARRRGAIIDHLWMRVGDVGAARRFYETIAPHAGLQLVHDAPDRVRFAGTSGSFSLVPGAPTENVHLAFATEDDGDVERFHRAATDAGYRSDGPPGERPRYHPGYFSAYVLDPDGNSIEVVNHHRRRATPRRDAR